MATPHIVFLPTPGMGHLIPIVELSKLLVDNHGFTVTIITFAKSEANSKAQQTFLDSLPAAITYFSLPPVLLDDVPDDSPIETVMSITSVRSIPALREFLGSLKETRNLVAFVGDLFAGDALEVARGVGVPAYIFIPTNLQLLLLMFHLPTLDAETTGEYRDLKEPVELPGCVPIPGSELLYPLQDRSNSCYSWMVHHARRYREADGILVNSFAVMEPGAERELRETETGRPPVYPVGPLVQLEHRGDSGEILQWLDKQPDRAVVFVSFGSGGALTGAQMRELALGLEESEQRFLWVVRSPSDRVSSAYFSAHGADNPVDFLPAGFVERTREKGLVVPWWAPQTEVLRHKATGGFLTHCGWNSSLESVVSGVPMIAWPLFAEQKMNAIMLTDGSKIALRPAKGNDGLVGREEVARVVKQLMEGEEGKEIRSRVRNLQAEAAAAMVEGGTSHKALAEVVGKWKGSGNPP